MASKQPNDRISVERSAVVDIGSNSVRLVIYDGPRRSPVPICNEKALCGLGRDKKSDGSFNPLSVSAALSTLARFARLLREHGDPPTHVIATAAVREAKDGKRFVEAVKALGFDVSVITGAEEAELAAYGVVSFEPSVSGIIGDMGGGSLELISVRNGDLKENTSLSIGPLSIMSSVGNDMAAAHKVIDASLDKVTWLNKKSAETLYSVGGAWRAVARIHMRLRKYPLAVLHRYEMTRAEVFDICDLIARQSRQSLEEIPGIPRRRIDTLPFAATVLKSVIERGRVKRVVISSGGVREGILYRNLSKAERKEDPLVASARFYAEKLSPDSRFGEAAFDVIDPLFPNDSVSQRRLRYVTALLTDIGAYYHPDHRARHAFDTALRAPFVGLSHQERVAIALTLFRRHNGRMDELSHEHAVGMLPWDQQQRTLRLGLAFRFVASVAPRISTPLHDCRLYMKDGDLVLEGRADHAELMGETPMKRFTALAAAFEAAPVTIFKD